MWLRAARRRRCEVRHVTPTVVIDNDPAEGTMTTTSTSTSTFTSTSTSTGVPITATPQDQALKAKHAAMWASGSYPTVVDDIVEPLGGILVETVDVRSGQRVLDVAAGTGTSALPSARSGAEVTATDLTPELLDV